MPTNLYGPGDNYHSSKSHVMASLIKKFCDAKIYSHKNVICWGTGNPCREFLHVEDLANAVIFALERWDPSDKNAPLDNDGNPSTILNVGTGKDISIKDLAIKIATKSNFKGTISWDKTKADGTPRKLLNIQKIKSLGWEPTISLDNGIDRTIEEYFNKKDFANN